MTAKDVRLATMMQVSSRNDRLDIIVEVIVSFEDVQRDTVTDNELITIVEMSCEDDQHATIMEVSCGDDQLATIIEMSCEDSRGSDVEGQSAGYHHGGEL